jgi:hypothetical protein
MVSARDLGGNAGILGNRQCTRFVETLGIEVESAMNEAGHSNSNIIASKWLDGCWVLLSRTADAIRYIR